MIMMRFVLFITLIIFTGASALAQDIDLGRLSGNIQIDAQTYKQDSTIGANDVPEEELLSNSFLNLIYNLGGFEVGLRYEAYINPLLGFDPRYEGQGIAYRYATYKAELFEVTGGNFYEQFGSGMLFRAYEERQLGFDNAMDGLRFKLFPTDGISITGIIGKQRAFWGTGAGIVRGGDLNLGINSLIPGFLPEDMQMELGTGVISKYQDPTSSFYNLPANVLAYNARLGLTGSVYSFNAEWAYKFNDPNATNNYNYNPGTGLLLNAAYFNEGIGATVNFHRTDNMDFRSDRNAQGTVLNINFIPPLTKQQIYRLATIFPFASQPNGEIGYQLELNFKIPKNTAIGGEYGTDITFNTSYVTSIDSVHTEIDSVTGWPFKYDSKFFSTGDVEFYRDFNLEISRKWSDVFKTNLLFMNFMYNRDVMENEGVYKYGFVNGNLIVLDMAYKFTSSQSLRLELEHLWADEDADFHSGDYVYGNWFMVMAEYTVAPSLYFSIWDEYNYFDEIDSEGNQDSRSLHYLSGSFAYVFDALRVSVSYGRQRGGLLCVGGVCRPVPPANGITFSLTASF
jgi:hypothetical protein